MCFCSYFNMSTTKQSWCVTTRQCKIKIALLIEHTSVSRASSPLSFQSRIYLLAHGTMDHPSEPRTIPLKDPKYNSDTGRASSLVLKAWYKNSPMVQFVLDIAAKT